MTNSQPPEIELDWEWVSETGINVSHFKVPKPVRRHGIGSRLLRRVLAQAQRQGAEYAVVNMKGGDGAEEFLTANGFEIVERQRDHVTGEKELDD